MRRPQDFWQSWPARLAVIASLVLTLAVAAVLGDPEAEPALTKIGEFAQHIVMSVGHGR